jgi:4-amino-4-deoxy-L-arabinose transferase-like glycosyltransferase
MSDLAVESPERRPGSRKRWQLWLSPADQPAWARPLLLGIAALSAVLYAWGSARELEVYYAAAVRSMSMSWHNFFYAAFDPDATVSIDKLPGALWVQALFVRVLGVHDFVLVMPQVIEGTLTVLVLYRVVRRLAGPLAGLVAAAVLTLSPASVALDRGNISDSLLILFLVLAVDQTASLVLSGRVRHAVIAGVAVGIAFQAKTVEAWLLLPALALAFVVAAPLSLRKRAASLAALGVVAAVVSLSWMTIVSLTPQSGRPYVDGSPNDSIYHQVFVYNGFGRLDEASPDQLLTQSIGIQLAPTSPPAWNRLLQGAYGRDTGWLVPAALVALGAGLYLRRRQARTDPLRMGLLLFGCWLILFFAVFSSSTTINAYYTAALSPPVAALVGIGLALAWERRADRVVRLVLAGMALASAAYGAWLLPSSGTGLPAWLSTALVVALAVLAIGCILAALARSSSSAAAAGPQVARFALPSLAVMLVPAVASLSIVWGHLGAFDTPFEPPQVAAFTTALIDAPQTAAALLPRLEKGQFGAPDLMATETAALAAPTIYVSGKEVLPIGGFTGTIPEPTLASLEAMVAAGDFHIALQSAGVTDPRFLWIAAHCHLLNTLSSANSPTGPLVAYFCGVPSLHKG